MHSLFIGAYWPSRRETKEQCARRVADFLARIESRPDTSQWFPKGKSAKSSTRVPVPATFDGVLPFIKTNNRDTDGSAIAELGFNLSLWNGGSVALSITCGAFAPAIRNSVVLNLHPAAELAAENLASLRELLEAIVAVWEPDNAVLTSPQLIAQNGGGMPWQTRGWLNYRKSEGPVIK
jgi:hypothetical protein